MPEISRFFGIIILMFADDHLPPHYHAKYAEFEATINIESGEILKGFLPKSQLRLVQAWNEIHKNEILINYNLLNSNKQTFSKIKPLE
ncbi:MAG: hypothetical protein A2046_04975 [Bacteroidetes bacterium GWA2_30_7]|nr:MAG: hypothetical protein A2046_04975 [Bacteroidetes bacterium GWA2_30_7]